MKLIDWKQNWNGGALSIEGVVLSKPDQIEPTVEIHRNAVKVGEGTITGTRSEVGSDDDHGHTYNWTTFDFNVRLDPIGYGVNIRSLIRQGFQVYGTLKETSNGPQ